MEGISQHSPVHTWKQPWNSLFLMNFLQTSHYCIFLYSFALHSCFEGVQRSGNSWKKGTQKESRNHVESKISPRKVLPLFNSVSVFILSLSVSIPLQSWPKYSRVRHISRQHCLVPVKIDFGVFDFITKPNSQGLNWNIDGNYDESGHHGGCSRWEKGTFVKFTGYKLPALLVHLHVNEVGEQNLRNGELQTLQGPLETEAIASAVD